MPKILFHASDDQKERWRVAAKGMDMSLSEWIRMRCDGEPRVELTGVTITRLPLEEQGGAGATPPGLPGPDPAPRAPIAKRGGYQPTAGEPPAQPPAARGPTGPPLPPVRKPPAQETISPGFGRRKKKEKEPAGSKAGLCEHRVPVGQFCKRCAA